jgi:hypothetical protein
MSRGTLSLLDGLETPLLNSLFNWKSTVVIEVRFCRFKLEKNDIFSKGMLLQALGSLKKKFDNHDIKDRKIRTNNNQVAEADQTNVASSWRPYQSAALFNSEKR